MTDTQVDYRHVVRAAWGAARAAWCLVWGNIRQRLAELIDTYCDSREDRADSVDRLRRIMHERPDPDPRGRRVTP